jgi:serine/threonine protein kinase/formylglycine-generating enzyme required for sulfatase activity
LAVAATAGDPELEFLQQLLEEVRAGRVSPGDVVVRLRERAASLGGQSRARATMAVAERAGGGARVVRKTGQRGQRDTREIEGGRGRGGVVLAGEAGGAPGSTPVSAGGGFVSGPGDVEGNPDGPSEPALDATLARDRYKVGLEIGRGGMGVIREAEDRHLGRHVALKLIREDERGFEELKRAFLAEAQVQGRLEHPSIVPVYDLGRLRDGTLYFAMRRVTGRSLHQIIEGLRGGDPEMRAEFGRARLLAIFQQVCGAISYAHWRGVLHCDLKPENVMVGEHGEVYVVDWGLSRGAPPPGGDEISSPGGAALPSATAGAVAGAAAAGAALGAVSRTRARVPKKRAVRGTPAYMAPERLNADEDSLSPLVDVYALGVVLYEILAHRPPFESGPTEEVLRLVAEGDFPQPSEVAPELEVPPELEDIALRAMAREPGDRYASVRELARAVEEFQEGTRTRARRTGEAAAHVSAGINAARRYRELRGEMETTRGEIAELARGLKPFDPVEAKRPVWRAEERMRRLEEQAFRAFGQAEDFFHQALGFIPDLPAGRNHLAQLYWERFREGEERGDTAGALYFRGLLQRYSDGRYEEKLRGDGFLAVETEGGDAEVTLYRLTERDRRIYAHTESRLGHSPIELTPLPLGSYLLALRGPGFREVLRPVLVARAARVKVRVRLYTDAEIGDDFVYVPAGRFVMGGDPLAPESLARGSPDLGDFFIGRYPVTVGEYAEFIEQVARRSADEARRRAPRVGGNGGAPWRIEPGEPVRLPDEPLEGTAAAWSARWPVFGVSFDDARAYCEWRSFRDGVAYRLPTEQEWEKAARGVDGRLHPWGDQFDPTFCKMALSRPGAPAPEEVGAFAADESPYGVRDLAGGVVDWVASWHDEARAVRVLRGGWWAASAVFCRAARRFGAPPDQVVPGAGFRLAKSPAGKGR